MESDFYPGMKVFLDGEFGVLMKTEFESSDFCGVICWDTDKDFDFEDWTGLFGTFLNQGGKIIDRNYQFKYINDDGTQKSKS